MSIISRKSSACNNARSFYVIVVESDAILYLGLNPLIPRIDATSLRGFLIALHRCLTTNSFFLYFSLFLLSFAYLLKPCTTVVVAQPLKWIKTLCGATRRGLPTAI